MDLRVNRISGIHDAFRRLWRRGAKYGGIMTHAFATRPWRRRPWMKRAALAVVLLGGLLVGSGCERRTRPADEPSSRRANGLAPTHVSWTARFTMTEEGRPRATLRAPRMEQYQAADSSYSVWRSMQDTTRVQMYLFDEDGDSSATVTADSLVFQGEKGVLDAYRNVVVTTTTGRRLQTEHLTWRQADRRIRTRRFVRIRTPKEVVQGNGLVADEDLDTYQIGRFSAEVEMDEEPEDGGPRP